MLFKTALVRYSELMATLCTAGSQHFTAISRFHTLTETMNCLAAAAVRLICTLHNITFCPFSKGSAKVG